MMAMMPQKVAKKLYLDQYVKTATNGNVTAEWAIFVDRVKLYCKKCEMTLTAAFSTSLEEIDYGIQEFVNLHAHKGEHCQHNFNPIVTISGEKWSRCTKCAKTVMPTLCDHQWTGAGTTGSCLKCGMAHVEFVVKATPVTMDFKKVNPTFVNSYEAEAKKYNATSGHVIDDDPLTAEKIKQKMQDYAKEMAAKQDAQALELKILQLQMDAKAAQIAQLGIQSFANAQMISPSAAAAEIEKQKAELQALKNVLQIMEMKKKNQQMSGKISGFHRDPPPERAKPLKQPTGRKFR